MLFSSAQPVFFRRRPPAGFASSIECAAALVNRAKSSLDAPLPPRYEKMEAPAGARPAQNHPAAEET